MDTPMLAALKRQPSTRTHFLYGKRVWVGMVGGKWHWATRAGMHGPCDSEAEALNAAHLALAPTYQSGLSFLPAGRATQRQGS